MWGPLRQPMVVLGAPWWTGAPRRTFALAAALLTVPGRPEDPATSGTTSSSTTSRALRRRDTWTNGEGYWGAKMDALLGR